MMRANTQEGRPGRGWLGLCLLCLGLFLSSGLRAQQEVEILPLAHRTVEEVLPSLRPLLEPGAALSGMNNQLILKATARNRAQIRQALAAIDTPPRRLVIRVSQSRDDRYSRQGGAISGEMASPGGRVRIIQPSGGSGGGTITLQGARGQVRGDLSDRQGASSRQVEQMVQVVEGGQAYIQVGYSLPVPLHQVRWGPNGPVRDTTVIYRDIGQGFYAQPRVVGHRVSLDISPRNDTPGRWGPGSAEVQELSTTVSGPLGEWLPLGSSTQSGTSQSRSWNGGEGEQVQQSGTVWIKVEELP